MKKLLLLALILSFVFCAGACEAAVDCQHIDADKNGTCDKCGELCFDGGGQVDEPEIPEDSPTTEDKPVEDEPTEDEPTVDKPVVDEPTEDKPTEDEPTEDKPVVDEPTEDKPVEDEPTEDKPVVDEPTEDKPVEDEPTEDKPVEDEPTEDKPVVDEPTEDKPVVDEPTEDKPAEDEPVVHSHSFTVRNADEKFLKSNATELAPASYYYSCECGEFGEESFDYGERLPGRLVFEKSQDNTHYLVGGYVGMDEAITVPEFYDGLPVLGIGANAFSGNIYVKVIVLPEAVSEIGARAFSGCTSLEAVNIPTGVSKIAEHSFSGCSSLKKIVIHVTVTVICDFAFEGCSSLSEITFNDGLKKIGDSSFMGCTSLSSVKIPDTVTEIGNNAFKNATSLASVTLSKGLTSLGDSAFEYCIELEVIVIFENVTKIGKYAFSNCSGLKNLSILGDILEWGDFAFSECRTLESIYLNSSASAETKLGNGVFSNAGADGDGIALNLSQKGAVPENLFETESAESLPKITELSVESGATELKGFGSGMNLPYLESIKLPETVTGAPADSFKDTPWWNNQAEGGIYVGGVLVGYKCKCAESTPAPAVEENRVEATCTVNGSYDSVIYCGVCETELSREATPIVAQGHAPTPAVEENRVEATCTEVGSYDSVVYCSVCEDMLSTEAKVIEKKPHPSTDWIIDKKATCAEAGAKHKECTECEEVLETASIDKLTTHTPGAAVTENYVDSDCATNGSYDLVVYCSVCEELLTSESKSVTKKPHTPTDWIIDKEATCAELGKKHKECIECEEVIKTEYIDKLTTHTSGESVVENRIEATCTRNGTYDSVVYCSVCDFEISRLRMFIIASHNIVDDACTKCDFVVKYSEGLKMTISADGTYYIVSGIGTCKDTAISIPRTYNGLPVKEIGMSAFAKQKITSVAFADGMTKIGSMAFDSCSYLLSVSMPDSLTTINSMAFNQCTSLTSVSLPDNIVSISKTSFDGCYNLNYTVVFDNAYYLGNENNPYLVLMKPVDNGKADIVVNNNTKVIADSAFNSCQYLKDVVLPDGLRVIGNGAFEYTRALEHITIPDSVTTIGNLAFYNSRLSEIIIPDSVTTIGDSAFTYCPVENLVIGSNVKTIGETAFAYCKKLESVIIPNSVEKIEYATFYDCSKLENVTIGSGVKSIERMAFCFCYTLKEFNVPSNVTSIGEEAFRDCFGLTEIILSNGITNIGARAFGGCSYLTTISIPDSIITIGESAFDGCSRLKYNEYENVSYLGNEGNPYLVLVKFNVKTECVFKILEDTKFIHSYAFYDCSNLVGINIPNSVVSIGRAAFAYTNLYDVKIPDSVVSLGDSAFSGCFKLRTITIGNGVTKIGYGTFDSCISLDEVIIPDNVTVIDSYAFAACNNLRTVRIGAGVVNINAYAFDGSKNLSSVEFCYLSGWKAGGSSFSVSTVYNKTTMAKYLRSDYCSDNWTRS